MIAIERLARFAVGDADDDAAEVAAVEEHILACSACATKLERLLRMGDAMRSLVRTGGFTFPVTASLADRLRAEGLVSRAYRLAREASVRCTVSAHDIYALTTLEAEFMNVTQVKLVVTLPAGLGQLEMADVPFDIARGTVSYVTSSSRLRQLPRVG